MTTIGPIGLSAVTGQVDAINQLVDGGFQAALSAAMSAGAPPVVEMAPTSTGTSTGPSTAWLIGAPSASQDPAVTASSGASPPELVNGLMAPASTPSSGSLATGEQPTGSEAVAVAERCLGTPYVWGGKSPTTGFDCSGLVQYVYGQLGIDLPRTSQQQATVGTPVAGLADARPGDLVFFAGSDGTPKSPGHVGIYVGNGQMIDAPYTGASVRAQPVGKPVEIRRVLPASTGGTFSSGEATVPGGPYAQLFASASAAYGLPAGLLPAIATAESNMDPQAVSSAGAEGLMQLMPQTAASLGVNPYDPAQAVPAAASLLSSYLQRFGSLPLAVAAYNAGPGAVEAHKGVPPYSQTTAYVQKVLALMGKER